MTRDELMEALAQHIGTDPLTDAEKDAVLELAAIVAHGTEDRTSAPLASFLAGLAAAGSQERMGPLTDLRGQASALTSPPGS